MNSISFIPFVLQTLMWAIARPMLWVFSNIRVVGKENLRGLKGGVIIAVNHLSDLDPILVPATLGPFSRLMPVFSITHERKYYKRPWPLNYFYGGVFFNLLGAYPVQVGTKKDYEDILKNQIYILERGGTVGIFPEGSRAQDGKIAEGKPGVAFLLWRTGRPVIPVAVHGHYEMYPSDFLFRKHSLVVSYGKPITREEIFGNNVTGAQPTREELKVAAQIIMSRIREMYEKI